MSWLQDAEVTLPKTDAELLADAQAAKIREINDAYTAEAEPLIREYPEVEQQSWTEQNREARAYLAWYADPQGDAPATPVLDNILLGRNGEDGTETLAELCEAVVNKAGQFTLFQQLTGKRHRLVKAVRTATTVEGKNAINW
jgi:post-segregation antitoxin (ccd killing protein)